MALISIRDLRKSFDSKSVLDEVNLDVIAGESLVVIGGSGTGKSVLLRCILGLEAVDSGEILFKNNSLKGKHRAEFMAQFGMLFQNAALFDSLPIWRNVAFALLKTMPAARARAIAIEKLSRVGLGPEVADLHPAELSGGMRKRAGLARAIAAEPRIIFFDEPTTGLDPIRAARINLLIRDIVKETGATAITITHDMSTVRTIADRVALLDQGRIRWQGGLAEMDDASDLYLHDFVHGRWRPEPDAVS